LLYYNQTHSTQIWWKIYWFYKKKKLIKRLAFTVIDGLDLNSFMFAVKTSIIVRQRSVITFCPLGCTNKVSPKLDTYKIY